MRLKTLQLESFRNYGKLQLEFDENQNLFLILGENAQGKTNVVEAIFLLALCKPFRPVDMEDLIKWDEDYFRISASVKSETDEKTLDIVHQIRPKKSKAHKVNGVKKTVTDFVGNIYVTLFYPDDLNLMFLAPAVRRKYLDIVLSQIDKQYLQYILQYKKIIKNRNQVLKAINAQKSTKDELFFWDLQLIDLGKKIVDIRQSLIDFFNTKLSSYYQSISKQEVKLELRYKGNMANKTQDELHKELENRLIRDLAQESTTLGPHRDDMGFFLNDSEMQHFCSRGEVRSAILSVKMAELDFFEEKTGNKPILLLDDAFSELDGSRKEFFLKLVKNHQTIITGTSDIANVFDSVDEKIYWKCTEGKIESE